MTKEDIIGFSLSANGDLAYILGMGGEGAIAPFVTNEINGYSYPTPLVTLKGGPRIGSPGANLMFNSTIDL